MPDVASEKPRWSFDSATKYRKRELWSEKNTHCEAEDQIVHLTTVDNAGAPCNRGGSSDTVEWSRVKQKGEGRGYKGQVLERGHSQGSSRMLA